MISHNDKQTTPVTISFSEELSSGIYLIGFKRTFDFIAGQVIGIAIRENDARRLYSICSGEQEDEIKILYKVIEEGYLTPQLSDLEHGDTIWITPAGGVFTADSEPAVWIASGTGLAPFYSMLRSGLGENKTLLHGNRYLEQFHFFDEFQEVLGQNYIRCCSAENGEGVYQGRVTEYLEEQDELNPALKYYLCGSADMVVETRDILISKGVPFGHIISEIYF
ncbi:MAG: FAD-binding oxidoreductase [Bacteroidota bacterium]|nr:FAD-binding oxidoreductase [Bacteroidota bacterium]